MKIYILWDCKEYPADAPAYKHIVSNNETLMLDLMTYKPIRLERIE